MSDTLEVCLSRITYLQSLLEHLPSSISERSYGFGLDPDDVEEEGKFYALNRNFEICFQTHTLASGAPIPLCRSKDYGTLIEMLKETTNGDPSGCGFLKDIWVEQLIRAAQALGAKVPEKFVKFSFYTWPKKTHDVMHTAVESDKLMKSSKLKS